jgi:energy-coupling factor transporter ATP-binding protein EcfA2
MIELHDISVSLPAGGPRTRTILDKISLTIRDGEWVALTGPNGSGKSTLLAAIAGVCPVSSGRLRWDGRETTVSETAVPGGVGLLLQEPDNQFVSSSVRNELLLSMEPSLDARERDARFTEAVDWFSLSGLLDRNPHRISGGEKQRLALATVWLSDPRVVLLDEPVSYLDPDETVRCVAFVREMNNQGVTVVWATPGGDDLREARRVVYLEEGRVRFDEPAESFEKKARTDGLDILAPGEGDTAPAAGQRPALGNPVVSMRSVSFAYDAIDVIREASAEILEREVVGIAGKNGAGKSTLLSIMSGVLDPTGGSIERKYRGPVVKKGKSAEQCVFYLFQSPERLFFAETVLEEVSFGLASLGIPRQAMKERAAEALALVKLDPDIFLDRSPFSLSLGEMRRVAFAMALALAPKLLLLDEPASCLDRTGRAVLAEVIETLRNKRSTVITASHDARYLRATTDRILNLANGVLV